MIAALVLVGLVLVAALSGTFGRIGAVALAGMSVLWLLVNGPMEGLVLLAVTRGHGVTGADLTGFTGLALAAYRWLVPLRRSKDLP
ncbi:MAG TPA: hypothetical protein VGD12_07160 [Blastococcus sp.]|jgi:hypothetical protein